MRTNSTKAANHVKPILRIMLILGIAVQTITLTACDKKCGEGKYNPETHFCSGSDVLDKCGGKEYEPDKQFCNGGEVAEKCGGQEWKPETQFCRNGSEAIDKCGGKEYNPETHHCHTDGETYSCGDKPLNPETEFCKENEVLGKCDGKEYNPAKQFCHKGKILSKCGFREYDPEQQICHYGRYTSGKDKKEKERAKVIKERIDGYGFASEKLSEFLIEKKAYCFNSNWEAINPNWEADKKELEKMEFSSDIFGFADYGLSYCEEDEGACDDGLALSLVMEKGSWKVFDMGDPMRCQ